MPSRTRAATSAPRTDPSRSLIEGLTIGDHFIVRRKLGGGGMGEVYLAENLNVEGKKYAIKVLRSELSADPRFVAMLQDEAAKQSRLEHDNVVGMYDFFAWGGHYCLVQNFVNGRTLAQMLAEQPNGLDIAVAMSLIEGVLSGLDHAHSIGILHCDVKPANVIVDADGRPRVTDFGISRDIGSVARSSGTLGAGTPEYMSPEQILPPYEVDHRSDVFSAGVMFFEMLCGRLPFQTDASSGADTLLQTVADAPDVRRFRADVPETLARIVATALQRDPEHRFQGCADFRQAIVEFRRRQRWNRTWLPAIVVMAVAAVAGAIGLYAWRESVDRQTKADAERNRRESAEIELRMRRTVDEALHNAATSFNLLCREAAEYAFRRPGLDIAIDSGDGRLADQFRTRLADIDGNMSRHAADYLRSMQRLSKMNPAAVASGVDAQAAADPYLQRVASLLKADDAGLRAGGSPPSRDQLLSRCPPAPTAALPR